MHKSTFLLRSITKDVGFATHELKWHVFHGGERHVTLPDSAQIGTGLEASFIIDAGLFDAGGILDLMMLVDALRNANRPGIKISLSIPYVPYARQDRVANPGEPLSIKVFCNLINSMNFTSVYITDPHSDVTPALLNNVHVTPSKFYVEKLITNHFADRRVTLVSPDAGARKKTEQLGIDLGLDVIFATKHRDTKTGKLSGTKISEGDFDMRNPLLVVDDICDGGGTFIMLAEELRKVTVNPLYLYVTHGIFSKGMHPLLEHYEKVFCPNAFDPAHARWTSIEPTPEGTAA